MPDGSVDGQSRRPLSLRDCLLYGGGQTGLAACGFIVLSRVQYLYEGNAEADLPRLAPHAMFVTVLLIGRLFDAITDPLVGWWSDRTRSRWGRRKPFIALGILPLGVCFTLLWTPPTAGESAANGWYLLTLLCGYFLAFTVVGAPYLALLPELSRTDAERNALATWQALCNVLGSIVGALSGVLVGLVTLAGLRPANPSHLFCLPGAIVALLAMACLALPLLGPKETRAQGEPPLAGGAATELLGVFGSRPFRHFIGAFFMVWFALQVLLASLPHLPVARLGVDGAQNEGWNSILLATALVAGAVSFPLVARVMAVRGRAWTFAASMLWFVTITPLLLLPRQPWGAVLVLVLAGPGIGGVMILPHALLADVTDHDARRHGVHREAIFYGMQGFVTKGAMALALVCASTLLTGLGATSQRPGGVLACPLAAGAAMVLGWFCFRGFAAAMAEPGPGFGAGGGAGDD